jgi:glycosyltransferase involved in cell wall biosynthesis
MAAGCVPVVINKGGQPEIVIHELNGLLWDTEEQLLDCTRKLMEDETWRQKLSLDAIKRAGIFSKKNFEKNFSVILSHWGP